MNKCILIGHLGADPEVRYSADGLAIANFSVATNEGSGEKKRTEWHRCVAFKRSAELISEHLRKGSSIALEGRIQTRSYEKDGIKRYTTEIVVDRFEFVGSKNDNGSNTQSFRQESVTSDFDKVPF